MKQHTREKEVKKEMDWMLSHHKSMTSYERKKTLRAGFHAIRKVRGRPARTLHHCQHCRREFDTSQKKRDHQRRCQGHKPAQESTTKRM